MRELMTIPEIAKALRKSESTIRKNWGSYGGFKVGGNVRFDPKNIENIMKGGDSGEEH